MRNPGLTLVFSNDNITFMHKEEPHNCPNIDELLVKTGLNIEKFGLQVIMVKETSYLPAFAYSVGLWQNYKHPEVICFGLSIDLMHAIINDVAEIIKQGQRIEVGKSYSNIFKNSSAEFLTVDPDNIKDYFGVAIRHYNHDHFPATQLVWTDRNDRFPWENEFEERFVYKQPLLDRNTTFKFREEKNLAVFTTRQWVDVGQPILRVVHDHDGDWQFLTGDQLPEDIRLVAIEEIVRNDLTLNKIFNLDYGESADRSHVGGEWIRSKEDNEEDENEFTQ
jgi:hypothetical protein